VRDKTTVSEIKKEKKDIEKKAEDRLKEQERETRKAEKVLTKGNKRKLAVIRGEQDRTREEETTQQDLKDKTETNEALDKAVRKGVEKLEVLRDDGLWWKSKYSAEKAEVWWKEEQQQEAAVELRERGRAGETATKRNADLVGELRAKLDSAAGQAKVSFLC
jgi:hypothetical protein